MSLCRNLHSLQDKINLPIFLQTLWFVFHIYLYLPRINFGYTKYELWIKERHLQPRTYQCPVGKMTCHLLSNVFKVLITAYTFASFLLGSFPEYTISVCMKVFKICRGWGDSAIISSANVCLTHWNCRLSNYFVTYPLILIFPVNIGHFDLLYSTWG